jgi:hypothetical protein
MDAYESLSIRPGTPHRHKSLLIFVQKPDRPLVCVDGTKRVSEDGRNALRTPQVVKLEQDCASGLGQITSSLLQLSYRSRCGLVHVENISDRQRGLIRTWQIAHVHPERRSTDDNR